MTLSSAQLSSAGELLAALDRRQVSSLELVDEAIDRIERLDGAINAVVVRDFERARETARSADEARASGQTGPLLGLPMTVKESHNVAGLSTTWGSPFFKDWVAPADAVGVARLKSSGAVILGKTNVPTFLADWRTENPIYGRTNNPLDLSRTPGGSSGGAAAALAAGMTTLEYGSDVGGSIRVPAAFCGVCGHKPSYGLIPIEGHQPPGSPFGAPPPLVVLGPMAKRVGDLGLALDVLAGPAREEAVGYRLALPGPRHATLRSYRVMDMSNLALAPLEAEIASAFERLADRLRGAGVNVQSMPPAAAALAGIGEIFGVLIEGVTAAPEEARRPGATSAGAWREALGAQAALRRRWAELFTKVDIVISPCLGTTAFTHPAGPDENDGSILINGRPSPLFEQMAWIAPASVANLPATVVPISRTRSGLPIAAQIIGPYLEDHTPLAFAAHLEESFKGSV